MPDYLNKLKINVKSFVRWLLFYVAFLKKDDKINNYLRITDWGII